MRAIRRAAKPISLGLVLVTLMMVVPPSSAIAALVQTETVLTRASVEEARVRVAGFMARPEVRAGFVAHGIDVDEAQARINSLTDAEILMLNGQLDRMPAGGDALGAIIITAGIIFVILIITDIVGVTDVFTFVR
jgi:hypothetical protein